MDCENLSAENERLAFAKVKGYQDGSKGCSWQGRARGNRCPSKSANASLKVRDVHGRVSAVCGVG